MKLVQRRTAAGLTLAVLVAACQDGLTAAPARGRGALADRVGGLIPRSAAGDARYACAVSWRTPVGPLRYRYKWVALRLPSGLRAASAATHVVHLMIHAPGGEIRNVVNCRVPNTKEADAFVAQRVAAYRAGGWRSLRLALRTSTLLGRHGTRAAALPGVTPQDDDGPPDDPCPPEEEQGVRAGAAVQTSGALPPHTRPQDECGGDGGGGGGRAW